MIGLSDLDDFSENFQRGGGGIFNPTGSHFYALFLFKVTPYIKDLTLTLHLVSRKQSIAKSGTMLLVYKVHNYGRSPFTLPATLPVTRKRESVWVSVKNTNIVVSKNIIHETQEIQTVLSKKILPCVLRIFVSSPQTVSGNSHPRRTSPRCDTSPSTWW